MIPSYIVDLFEFHHIHTQEARSLPFVGERLANKIYEIITSGHLRRLDQVDQEKEKVITMFKGIHGVGATTAQQFYAKVCIIIIIKYYGQNIGGKKQILAVR